MYEYGFKISTILALHQTGFQSTDKQNLENVHNVFKKCVYKTFAWQKRCAEK